MSYLKNVHYPSTISYPPKYFDNRTKGQQKWTNRIHLARCSFIIPLVESRPSLICCIIRGGKVIRARVRRIVNAWLLGNACQAHLPEAHVSWNRGNYICAAAMAVLILYDVYLTVCSVIRTISWFTWLERNERIRGCSRCYNESTSTEQEHTHVNLAILLCVNIILTTSRGAYSGSITKGSRARTWISWMRAIHATLPATIELPSCDHVCQHRKPPYRILRRFSSLLFSLLLQFPFICCFLPGSFETFRMRSDYRRYTGCCILESSNSKGLTKREECYGKFVDKRCVTELQRSNRTYEVDGDRFFITAHESRPCYGVGVVTRVFITW